MDIRTDYKSTKKCANCGKKFKGGDNSQYCEKCKKELDQERKRLARGYYPKNPPLLDDEKKLIDEYTHKLYKLLDKISQKNITPEGKIENSWSILEILEKPGRYDFVSSLIRYQKKNIAISKKQINQIRQRFNLPLLFP